MYLTKNISLHTTQTFQIINLTQQVHDFLHEIQAKDWLINIFTRHTTAILRINEAEEGFWKDLQIRADKNIPLDTFYHHDDLDNRDPSTMVSAKEENLNGFAHLRAMVLWNFSETIPVQWWEMMLGRRQKILFIEMDCARPREIILSFSGEIGE